MKKSTRRLALSRETVVQLSNRQLQLVAGGTEPCSYRCSAYQCPTLVSCVTCGCQATESAGQVGPKESGSGG